MIGLTHVLDEAIVLVPVLSKLQYLKVLLQLLLLVPEHFGVLCTQFFPHSDRLTLHLNDLGVRSSQLLLLLLMSSLQHLHSLTKLLLSAVFQRGVRDIWCVCWGS